MRFAGEGDVCKRPEVSRAIAPYLAFWRLRCCGRSLQFLAHYCHRRKLGTAACLRGSVDLKVVRFTKEVINEAEVPRNRSWPA